MRSRFYHSYKNPDVLPNVREYEVLKRETYGVTLATIVPPDRPWKKVRASQTKRGMRSKTKLGGRPPKEYPGYKKEIRDKWHPVARRLYAVYDSVTKVQRVLEQKTGKKFAWSTVKDWVQPKKP